VSAAGAVEQRMVNVVEVMVSTHTAPTFAVGVGEGQQ